MSQYQKEQYRRDLERQIEEKKNRETPNSQYATTYDMMTAQDHPYDANRNYGQRQQHGNQYQSNNYVVPYGSNSNYNNNYPPQNRNFQPIVPQRQQIAQTSLAPISINFGSGTKSELAPVLPRVPHATVVDPSSFGQRVNSVLQVVSNISSSLSSAQSSESALQSQALPMLNTQINQLRSDIEHLAGVEVANRAKVLIQSAKANREIVEVSESSVNHEISHTRDLISSANAAVSQFTTKYNDFSENTKATFIAVKSDLQRGKQGHDSLQMRMDGLGKRVLKSATDTSSATRKFEKSDQSASSAFNSLQTSINGLIQSASMQLSSEIKTESETRSSVSSALHGQVQEVNQRAASSVSALKNYIGELANSFSTSVSSIQSNLSEAINKTMDDNEVYFRDINERLDQLLNDSETNFNTIQTEIVSTIEEVKNTTVASFSLIESTLTDENAARKKNEAEIRKKYENFQTLINKELVIQMETVQQMADETAQKSMQHIHNVADPIILMLKPLYESISKLNDIDSQIGNLEGTMQILSSQMIESIGSLTRNLNEVSESHKTLLYQVNAGFKELETRLAALDDPETKEDIALREEIHKFSGHFDEDIDGRLDDIEQQISVVLANIAELEMGYPVNIPSFVPQKQKKSLQFMENTQKLPERPKVEQKTTKFAETQPTKTSDQNAESIQDLSLSQQIDTKSSDVSEDLSKSQPINTKSSDVSEDLSKSQPINTKSSDVSETEPESAIPSSTGLISSPFVHSSLSSEPINESADHSTSGVEPLEIYKSTREVEQALNELDPEVKPENNVTMFNPEDFVIKLSPKSDNSSNKNKANELKPTDMVVEDEPIPEEDESDDDNEEKEKDDNETNDIREESKDDEKDDEQEEDEKDDEQEEDEKDEDEKDDEQEEDEKDDEHEDDDEKDDEHEDDDEKDDDEKDDEHEDDDEKDDEQEEDEKDDEQEDDDDEGKKKKK